MLTAGGTGLWFCCMVQASMFKMYFNRWHYNWGEGFPNHFLFRHGELHRLWVNTIIFEDYLTQLDKNMNGKSKKKVIFR